MAENPPSSLTNKFDKIIHIDCSRWKSRRGLQRRIADELKLPEHVMALFDTQDEEDDFSKIDECSRAEIAEVTRVILGSLLQHRCLVLFLNGSNDSVDLYGCGLPPLEVSGTTVLWTFGGRLRCPTNEITDKIDTSNIVLSMNTVMSKYSNFLVWEEAKEILLYTHKYGFGITPEIVTQCLLYLLTLDSNRGSEIMDYNWATHASNYWVCDGIIVGDQYKSKAWKVARALRQEIQLEDYSSTRERVFSGEKFDSPPNRWIFTTNHDMQIETPPGQGTTSLFLAWQHGSESDQPVAASLLSDMFHQADQLRVLKLCQCSFSFSTPPFHCCRNLRFLGLDRCMDSTQGGEVKEKDRQAALEIFQRLWVLDACHTNWELDFPDETDEQIGPNMREIHINKGRIWQKNLSWRRLQNLHKLRVIEPTRSWVTGEMDEFTDMVKLEHLDLSGNSTIQVLPTLSRATSLKNLVLDGCVGLKQVGPEGLPSLLETFSLDVGSDPKVEAKLVKISLAGCVHLKIFLLRGALPKLEKLNLSGTSIRKVDLSDEVVQVPGLEKVFLMGCKQLRAVMWWKLERRLKVLCIDCHERNSDDLGRTHCSDSSSINIQQKNYDGYVIASDVRIIQSLLLNPNCSITTSLYLYLHVPPSTTSNASKGQSTSTKPCCYSDVLLQLQGVLANVSDDEIVTTWPAPLDFHMEVGEGICFSDMQSRMAIEAMDFIMRLYVDSLHVHDNSRTVLGVTPKLGRLDGVKLYRRIFLKWCRVERCPKLQAVFVSYDSRVNYIFNSLTTIWASDLLAARCIWHKGTICNSEKNFEALKSIHLHNCPRLKYVLPLGSLTLPTLKTLHITHCSDLRHVFPRDVDVPAEVEAQHTVREFKMLEHIYLDDLPSLERICEGCSMSAPVLQCVKLRGCWSLRRLPNVGHDCHPRPVVNCEKDCWDKLEWDGLEVGHHPSLYDLCQSSSHYKKPLPTGTLLR
uniref:Disease resistance protein At4g27190-like leucine-rich repeats domain-containing protein n=2 Tax=Oryza brachyantha TaxID=4533 RepID=J3N0T4_ORYBR